MFKFYHKIALLCCILVTLGCKEASSGAAVAPVVLQETPVPSVTPSPIAIVTPTIEDVTVTCSINTGYANGAVNVRACGSLECNVIGLLYETETVTLLEYGDWAQIVDNAHSVTGWVYALYLSCKEE